jgi:uncharacterized protein (TIGR02246 family)
MEVRVAVTSKRKERFMSDATTQDIRATFANLSEAWKNGDGVAFSECCTEDVDFINLLGMHVKGRRAVAELHEKIFRGPYKDSTVEFTIQSLRFVSPRALLVIAPSRIDVPSGPVKGVVLSIASILFVRDDDRWKLANFHNTRREATQADHLAIMREAVRS